MFQLQPFRHRIMAYVLFVLFAYNTVCCHLTLWIWKVYMNEQIEEFANTLSNNELEHFVMPATTEIEHELEINGRMYDVIRYEQNETRIHYWCIPDFAENVITSGKNSDELLSNAHHLWKGHLKNISKKASQLYYSCYDINPKNTPEKLLPVSSYLQTLQPKRVYAITPPPRLRAIIYPHLIFSFI